MIDDLTVDEFIQPIINLYQKIEYELLLEVAKRFSGYDEVTGTLEWQLKKLQELGALNQQALNVFEKYSEKSEKEIKRMLEQAGLMNLDIEVMQEAFEQGALTIDPTEIMQSQAIKSTIEQSYKSINQTFRMIKTKALESTRQAYINTLNQAYLETASGMYDGQTAIRRAVQTLASNGIQGATYKRGNKYVRYSIEGTVRRDVITAVHQLSNNVTIQSCDEMNVEYVEVSQHIGARVHPTDPIANHYGWQGKVYKINGSEPGYPNLELSTGYPDDILGLGGVNCRHRMFPFWKGISTRNPIKYDEEENKRIYEARQHQRKLERDMRLLKKKKACADAIGDTETSDMLNIKIQAKSNELNNWCKANNLKRDYSRELVSEQIVKKSNLTNSLKNVNINIETKIINGQSTSSMNEAVYNKMKNGLEKNGVTVIEAKGDDLKFLNALGAEASYSNGYIMHIGKIPSASAMFEETIHAQQAKVYGELTSSNPIELYAREVAANRMLKRNYKAYRFTKDDFNEISANLALWEKRFKKEAGVEYDKSEYFRGI